MVNFFQIPKWLTKSLQIKLYLDRINELGIGSEEWIESMNQEYPSTMEFPETDEINSYQDFLRVKEVSEFTLYQEKGETGYPVSLYVYCLLNQDKVLRRLKRIEVVEGTTSYLKHKEFLELIEDPRTYFKRKNEILELVGDLDLPLIKELRDSLNINMQITDFALLRKTNYTATLSLLIDDSTIIDIYFYENGISNVIKMIENNEETLNSVMLGVNARYLHECTYSNYSSIPKIMKELEKRHLDEKHFDETTLIAEKTRTNYNLHFYNDQGFTPTFIISRFNRLSFLDSLYKCDKEVKDRYVENQSLKGVVIDREKLDRDGFPEFKEWKRKERKRGKGFNYSSDESEGSDEYEDSSDESDGNDSNGGSDSDGSDDSSDGGDSDSD